MSAERVTPARSKSPTISSIWRSVLFCIQAISDCPCDSLIDHLRSKREQHQTENQAQNTGFGLHQNANAQQRAGENAQHDWHGESGIDVAAIKVNAGAGGGGYADHEV